MSKPRTQYNRATKKYEPVTSRPGLINCCPVCGSTYGTIEGKRFWCNTAGCVANRTGGKDGKTQ